MPNNNPTTKFKADISELRSEFRAAQREIQMANSKFKAATGGMDNWSKSADGLTAKLEQLNDVQDAEKNKLSSLKSQYELVCKEQGKTSKGAQELLIKINNQMAAVAKCESQISKYKDKLVEVKNKSTETKTASEKLNTTISEQESQLKELKDKYSDVVLEQGKNSQAAKDLKSDISKLSSELKDNKAKIQKVQEAADKLDKSFEESSNENSGISAFRIAVGNLMSEGIKNLIGYLRDTVIELGNVDSAYNNFATKTGTSTKEMEKYKEQIKDLYKGNYGEDLNDIADAMALVKQNTKETDPSKIKELTKNAIVLRDTFGYDIQETMRAANMLVDQFGISGTEAFNLIVQGAQNGLDKNGDLLDSINEYSVHYKQMGYDANDFFNMLKNGSEAGTFSIDKLGDAAKEFGIRTKDTSKTTTDGFALLGYTSKETAQDVAKTKEQISKTKDEISKLEKNLKYAKMEQQGFNDKTSELTKIKNADKVKEYTQKLETAKKKLTDLSKESSNSGKSIEDLQKKFAAGGEKAQEATTEVLQALFKMDDKVKQNEAGVALFGTMWEDLGVEGVKALMKTQGSLDSTKKSMEELDKIKYDDMKKSIKAIGREFKTEVLLPVVEKAIPKIRSAINWGKKNKSKVITTLTTIGTAMAGIFVTNKVSKFIGSIKTLLPMLKTLVSPTGIVATGAVVTTGLLMKMFETIQKAEQPTGEALNGIREESSKLSKAQQKIRDKTDDCLEAFKDWKTAKDEAIKDKSTEFEYYDELWDELQGIVDQNGKIKTGYDNRAAWISEKLEGVTGTEIRLNGNVIQNYKDLKKSIDDVLIAKKAEAYYNAHESSYQEALSNKNDTLANMQKEKNSLKGLRKEYSALQDKVESAESAVERAKIIHANAYRTGSKSDQMSADFTLLDAEEQLGKAKAKLAGKYDAIVETKNKIESLELQYSNYVTTIKNHENLGSAIISGERKKIEEELSKLQHGFITAETGTKASLQKQTQNYKTELANLKQAIKEGVPGVTQAQVEEMQKFVSKSETELKKLPYKAKYPGEQTSILFSQGIEEKKQKVLEKAKELGKDAALKLGEADTAKSADNFIAGFTNRLKERKLDPIQETLNLGSSIVSAFNEGLDEHSPSEASYESGDNFIKGFTNSLNDKLTSVKQTIGGLALSIIKEFNDEMQSGDFDLSGITVAANRFNSSNNHPGSSKVVGGVVNNITYNQTNQSPKALDRLDIYRNTKNLLRWRGGGT